MILDRPANVLPEPGQRNMCRPQICHAANWPQDQALPFWKALAWQLWGLDEFGYIVLLHALDLKSEVESCRNAGHRRLTCPEQTNSQWVRADQSVTLPGGIILVDCGEGTQHHIKASICWNLNLSRDETWTIFRCSLFMHLSFGSATVALQVDHVQDSGRRFCKTSIIRWEEELSLTLTHDAWAKWMFPFEDFLTIDAFPIKTSTQLRDFTAGSFRSIRWVRCRSCLALRHGSAMVGTPCCYWDWDLTTKDAGFTIEDGGLTIKD